MTTRRHFLGTMLAASAGGLLAACASPSFPAAGSIATQAAKVDLTLGHFVPTAHEFHAQLLAPWAADIEQRSGGRIKITIHPGGALGPAPAQYKNIVGGAMDIGFGVQSYTPGRFPLTEAMELPFMWRSAEQATTALHTVYAETNALQAEYADTKLLALYANGPAHLMSTRRPIRVLEDLKGLKLRSPGPVHNKVIEALGGVPLSLPASEMYDALERGVVDATVSAPSVLTSFNLADVVRYAANVRFTVSTFFVAMNRARWDSLSASDQRLIGESANTMLAQRAATICDVTDIEASAAGRARGVDMYDLPPGELERWQTATRAVPEEWLRSHDGAARLVYERLVQLSRA